MFLFIYYYLYICARNILSSFIQLSREAALFLQGGSILGLRQHGSPSKQVRILAFPQFLYTDARPLANKWQTPALKAGLAF